MDNEIWKDIEGYEGLYQVSNMGRVKSLQHSKEKILKPHNTGKGYLMITLSVNGKKTNHFIHRLVGLVFIPNPHKLPCINHKNCDRGNNMAENLEWCDYQYNTDYSVSKPILQYTKNGEFVREWKSIISVEKNTNYNNAHISKCCKGLRKTAYGYIWKYKGAA